jgi:hypothetical protein
MWPGSLTRPGRAPASSRSGLLTFVAVLRVTYSSHWVQRVWGRSDVTDDVSGRVKAPAGVRGSGWSRLLGRWVHIGYTKRPREANAINGQMAANVGAPTGPTAYKRSKAYPHRTAPPREPANSSSVRSGPGPQGRQQLLLGPVEKGRLGVTADLDDGDVGDPASTNFCTALTCSATSGPHEGPYSRSAAEAVPVALPRARPA